MRKAGMLIVLCLVALAARAQVRFGFKAGMSTTEVKAEQLQISNISEIRQLGLSVADAHYGLHAGLLLRFQLGKFYLQPEAVINSNKVDYKVKDLTTSNGIETIKTERYQYLDLPVMAGLKFGPLRVNAGPVAHVYLNNTSNLFDLKGYSQDFKTTTWGWQGGIGLDIWKLNVDLRYEGNFDKFGDHLVFAGQKFNFSSNPACFIASVGFVF